MTGRKNLWLNPLVTPYGMKSHVFFLHVGKQFRNLVKHRFRVISNAATKYVVAYAGKRHELGKPFETVIPAVIMAISVNRTVCQRRFQKHFDFERDLRENLDYFLL